jgi:hypothetical protein
MSQNKLQVVGRTGAKKVYLNISESEALERYHRDTQREVVLSPSHVETISFDDHFLAHGVHPPSDLSNESDE